MAQSPIVRSVPVLHRFSNCDHAHECTCSSTLISRYQKRLSGPLLDRIDIHVEVPRGQAEASAVRSELNRLGALLGYAASRGDSAGEGGTAKLMLALARGEVVALPVAAGGRDWLAGVFVDLARDERQDGHKRALCLELAQVLNAAPAGLGLTGGDQAGE
jgi:hypothetical protein